MEQPADGSCGKRLYPSACVARRQHSRAGYRIRVYPARECCGREGYHVTNADKRERRGRIDQLVPRHKQKQSSIRRSFTPAEEQQLVENAIARAAQVRMSQGAR